MQKVQNNQLGVGNLLTTDKLASVRIASVVGGFHLATQGKAVGYDRYILARVGLHIRCHSRTPSRKIPQQAKAIVRSLLPSWGFGGIGFSRFPSATIFLVITSFLGAVLHRVFIVVRF